MPTILGFSGKKGHGKNTLSAMICDCIPEHIQVSEIAFADALKDEVAIACGVSRQYIDEHKAHFRLILQGWGTEFRRELHGHNYWIDRLTDKINAEIRIGTEIICVTDVRFGNEFDLIKRLGGTAIRVIRPSVTHSDNHASETDLDLERFDWTVVNDGSLDNLRDNARLIVEKTLVSAYSL